MTEKTGVGIRYEEGSYLPQSVEETVVMLDEPFCDISGFGELAWVDLEGPLGEPLRLDGPLVLTDFKGRIRNVGGMVLKDYVVTLSRQTDNGIQMLGGKLFRGRVKFAELTITPISDPSGEVARVIAKSTEEAPIEKLVSDSSLPDPPAEQDEGETTKELDTRWARAIHESNRVQERAKKAGIDFDGPDVHPQKGDYVNHRQFGKCTVIRIGDEHITLAKPDKRKVQLGLAILRFTPEGEEGGHNIFRVEVQSRK